MSNSKVLIVEDDADVRLGYHVLLRAHKYETFFAPDGVSAVSEPFTSASLERKIREVLDR